MVDGFVQFKKIFLLFKTTNLLPFSIRPKNNSLTYCYKKTKTDKCYFIFCLLLINILFIYCLKFSSPIENSLIMELFNILLQVLHFLTINIIYISCYNSSKHFFKLLLKIYDIEIMLNHFYF